MKQWAIQQPPALTYEHLEYEATWDVVMLGRKKNSNGEMKKSKLLTSGFVYWDFRTAPIHTAVYTSKLWKEKEQNVCKQVFNKWFVKSGNVEM